MSTPTPNPSGPALNKSDACTYLGKISTATLMRRVASGEITPTIDQGRTMFRVSDLDDYLTSKRQPPVKVARRRKAVAA